MLLIINSSFHFQGQLDALKTDQEARMFTKEEALQTQQGKHCKILFKLPEVL